MNILEKVCLKKFVQKYENVFFSILIAAQFCTINNKKHQVKRPCLALPLIASK